MSNTKHPAGEEGPAPGSLCATCARDCKQPLGAVCLTCPRYVEQVALFEALEEEPHP